MTTTTAGATGYAPLTTGRIGGTAVPEVRVKVPFRTAGTMSKLYVRIVTNGTTASSTVTVRKNEAATAMTVTIGIGATGEFEDVTNQVAVAVGDYMAIQHITGTGGTIGTWQVSVLFDASPNTVTVLQSADFDTATSASITRFNCLSTLGGSTNSTEAGRQYTARTAGSLKNLAVSTATNARTTASTVNSRKDTANGALLVTVLDTSDNVILEDTANIDTIVNGSLINWAYTVGTGVGVLNFEYVKCEFVTTNNTFLLYSGSSTTVAYTFATTRYDRISSLINGVATTESHAQVKTRMPMNVTNLQVNVPTNTINSGTSTVTLRKNAADTVLAASIGFGATGIFEDTTDTIPFGELDEINHSVVVSGSSGTLSVSLIAAIGEEITETAKAPMSLNPARVGTPGAPLAALSTHGTTKPIF